MTHPSRPELPAAVHRELAAQLFNHTWALLDRTRRSVAENDEMVHAAHASRYHWGKVGTSVNLAIGEWQISRVYATLGRAEPALHHGRRSLEIARRAHLGHFSVAYGHEALARAFAVAHRPRERNRHLRLARLEGERIRDSDDRRMLFEDLATIR